jgi:hypothetical protein
VVGISVQLSITPCMYFGFCPKKIFDLLLDYYEKCMSCVTQEKSGAPQGGRINLIKT